MSHVGSPPHQHYGAACDLPTAVNKSIRTSTADSGGSRSGATKSRRRHVATPRAHRRASRRRPIPCRRYTRRLTRKPSIARERSPGLATYADGYDIPVLVTRNERNEFTEPVATVADHHLECEQTRMGPRVVGEDFETLVYPSTTARTTRRRSFAYWQQLLAARATQVGVEPTTPAPNRRPLRRASERASQLTVRRWRPPQIPCSMRGPRPGPEGDSDGAHEPNTEMHCGPSKSAGRSSGGHCGVATNRASTGCSSTPANTPTRAGC